MQSSQHSTVMRLMQAQGPIQNPNRYVVYDTFRYLVLVYSCTHHVGIPTTGTSVHGRKFLVQDERKGSY